MFRRIPSWCVLFLQQYQCGRADLNSACEIANLDPTGKSTDAELWSALEQCRLKEHVEGMGEQLLLLHGLHAQH